MAAQEVRALLTARKLVQSKLYDIEMSLRGILRGFGLKVGPTTSKQLCGTDQSAGRRPCKFGSGGGSAAFGPCGGAARVQRASRRACGRSARADARVRLLMSTPGVGPIVALTYVSAIDDPARFTSSKSVGAHFGLTPKKYQSGETDVTGRISKMGDSSVRTALYEAAHVILTRPIKGGGLKSWAMKLAKRAGMKKAKVALARKLAVVLHRMWVDASKFDFRESERLHARGGLRRGAQGFRVGPRHQPSRSEVPSPGRWIRSDRKIGSGIATTRT